MIMKLLGSLLNKSNANREKLTKMYRFLLENSKSWLRLQTAEGIDTQRQMLVGSSSLKVAEKVRWRYVLERFPTILDNCLALDLHEHISKLLMEIFTEINGIEAARESDKSRTTHCVVGFLEEILRVLSSYRRFAPPPTLIMFCKAMLRRAFLKRLPKLPQRLPGWSHKPRGCGQATCGDCQILDTFLTSPNERVHSFCMAERRRMHIETRLHSAPTCYNTRTEAGRTKTLIVSKLKMGGDYLHEMSLYEERRRALDIELEPLQLDSVRNFLGEDAYNELILLEDAGLSEPKQQSVGSKRSSDTQGGNKRKRRV
jgi:hypothetical protein